MSPRRGGKDRSGCTVSKPDHAKEAWARVWASEDQHRDVNADACVAGATAILTRFRCKSVPQPIPVQQNRVIEGVSSMPSMRVPKGETMRLSCETNLSEWKPANGIRSETVRSYPESTGIPPALVTALASVVRWRTKGADFLLTNVSGDDRSLANNMRGRTG